ncbi:hypothetical protein [Natronorubrum halophilum]|nr:hypothetical protein [Natronorubrum halophilum]
MSGGSRYVEADARADESIHHVATASVVEQVSPCRVDGGADESCA